ncbi:MAG: adenylate/guanylate cyclase domain-containing protein [Ardenticatenales bacterium]|nr:adenylate/guanylate cyclase domain-containing protein [Ardenticatenales bacterium]
MEPAIEQALARETLKSERRRVLLLATIFTTLFFFALVRFTLFPEEFAQLFRGQLHLGMLSAGLIALVGYELIIWNALGAAASHSTRRLTVLRYMNAIEEITLPTLGILVARSIFGPLYALITPFVFIYFLFISLSALRLDWRLSVFTGLGAALQYSVVAAMGLAQVGAVAIEPRFLSMPIYHLEIAGLMVINGLIIGFVASQIRQHITTLLTASEEQERILRVFGQHVSPAVAEKLLRQGETVPNETRYVCVMFLDIRGFTQYAEHKAPEEVIAYLNDLFAFMIDIVNRHQGIVNKFLGDGFMAVFGAPLNDEHASASAVAAAQDILEMLEVVNASGGQTTRVGIGLHAGEAVTGTVGSAHRQEYTIIGDVVNLASRIEQMTKQVEARLLVSESVWEALPPECRASAIPLGPVPVRGHEEPLPLYRLA